MPVLAEFWRCVMAVKWKGVIAPLNTPDAVGRKIKMTGTPKTRNLPLPLRYQPADWGGHSGAVRVGSIDRVWIEDSELWGEGRFDSKNPVANDVLRQVRDKYVRHMSADIEPVTDKLMAATIVDIPAFEKAQITYVDALKDEDRTPELVTFSFPQTQGLAFTVAPDEPGEPEPEPEVSDIETAARKYRVAKAKWAMSS